MRVDKRSGMRRCCPFGGGMGNISRGGKTSDLPRYLEGARYAAQWSGFPYPVYSPSEGKNDYTDDINARSRIINYLSGNSVYNPKEKGLGVPFEMTLGVHSDAGFPKKMISRHAGYLYHRL